MADISIPQSTPLIADTTVSKEAIANGPTAADVYGNDTNAINLAQAYQNNGGALPSQSVSIPQDLAYAAIGGLISPEQAAKESAAVNPSLPSSDFINTPQVTVNDRPVVETYPTNPLTPAQTSDYVSQMVAQQQASQAPTSLQDYYSQLPGSQIGQEYSLNYQYTPPVESAPISIPDRTVSDLNSTAYNNVQANQYGYAGPVDGGTFSNLRSLAGLSNPDIAYTASYVPGGFDPYANLPSEPIGAHALINSPSFINPGDTASGFAENVAGNYFGATPNYTTSPVQQTSDISSYQQSLQAADQASQQLTAEDHGLPSSPDQLVNTEQIAAVQANDIGQLSEIQTGDVKNLFNPDATPANNSYSANQTNPNQFNYTNDIGNQPIDPLSDVTWNQAIGKDYLDATNPLLWNSPTVAATFDPNSTSTANNNPNQANQQQAAAVAQNPTQQGVNSLNNSTPQNHTPTPGEIQALERQTNLTLVPLEAGGELARVKHYFSEQSIDKYYLLLNLLVYGFDNKILSSGSYGKEHLVIDDLFLKQFLSLYKIKGMKAILDKTPAGQKKCFDDIGKVGVTEANVNNMSNNPMTGPAKNTPSLVEQLLNKIHPDAVKNLESLCNKIRTHAYLTLPKGSFGSLQRLVAGINGVITAFQAIINDIYNGIVFYIQQAYAWINGQLQQAQRWLMEQIEHIIPLDLICLLLDTFQTILSDIGFFGSLFNLSGPFANIFNEIQNFTNLASNFISNPFTALSSFLPPQISQYINLFNQIGTDPGGFLADQLSNHGYAAAATALQGNIVGALVSKFGPQYAAMSPIGNILSKSSAIYNRFGQGAQFFPPFPASLGPNVYQGGKLDAKGQPISPGNIGQNIASDYANLKTAAGQAGNGFSSLGTDISNGFSSLGTDIKNLFGGK